MAVAAFRLPNDKRKAATATYALQYSGWATSASAAGQADAPRRYSWVSVALDHTADEQAELDVSFMILGFESRRKND